MQCISLPEHYHRTFTSEKIFVSFEAFFGLFGFFLGPVGLMRVPVEKTYEFRWPRCGFFPS